MRRRRGHPRRPNTRESARRPFNCQIDISKRNRSGAVELLTVSYKIGHLITISYMILSKNKLVKYVLKRH
jgi:hypothetical protein